MTLNGFDQHIALYAKGYYPKHSDSDKGLVEDIKTIIGFLARTEPAKVCLGDVYHTVVNAFWTLAKLEPDHMANFLKDLASHFQRSEVNIAHYAQTKEILIFENMLRRYLSFIENTKMVGRHDKVDIDMGKVDPDLVAALACVKARD